MMNLEINAATLALMDTLRQTPVGEIVTFAELSNAIGMDVRQSRYLLHSALTILQREEGACFGNRRGIGYQRLRADDAPKIGNHTRLITRRAAKRGRKKITSLINRANDLSDDARRLALREISTLGLIEHISKDNTQLKPDPDRLAPEPVAITARRFLAAFNQEAAE